MATRLGKKDNVVPFAGFVVDVVVAAVAVAVAAAVMVMTVTVVAVVVAMGMLEVAVVVVGGVCVFHCNSPTSQLQYSITQRLASARSGGRSTTRPSFSRTATNASESLGPTPPLCVRAFVIPHAPPLRACLVG